MSLSDIRDEFIKLSGRYDLGTIGGADNGANWYINAGQKTLDRRMANEDMLAKRIGVLASGEYLKIFRQAKVIKGVWLIDSDGDIITLEPRSYITVRDFYKQQFNAMDTGTPQYWCPAYVKLDGNLTIDEMAFTIDSLDEYIIDASLASNGIVVVPPPDQSYTLDILGKFYSVDLEDDGDVSLWTESYPHILVYAALYHLEVSHRNTAGANDWLIAVDTGLIDIDKDSAEFVAEHITQMGG